MKIKKYVISLEFLLTDSLLAKGPFKGCQFRIHPCFHNVFFVVLYL
jgi:hypothetical protein